MKAAFLSDRGVVKVEGAEARDFLGGLVTADMALARPGIGLFAALLTPQGKIVADMIVQEIPAGHGGGFVLDCPSALTADLVGKLKLYRLRAKIGIEDISENCGVLALWGGTAAPAFDLTCTDPRTDRLGWRMVLPPDMAEKAAAVAGATLVAVDEYEALRISLRVPRGGVDFPYGGAFPHEANMDLIGGVSFAKGCYVGQEVVSRMEHRGTARTRILRVIGEPVLPEPGTAIEAGGKQVGTMGSQVAGRGLAMLRVDRVADARDAGHELRAGNLPLHVDPDDQSLIAAGANAGAQEARS